jgi:predicted phosphohydrolase
MTPIHSQATYGGWRRVSHRPRRASLLQKALAAVRGWRRRLQDRNRSSALDERTFLDSEICRGDTFYLDSTQRERDAWLDTLHFPPF